MKDLSPAVDLQGQPSTALQAPGAPDDACASEATPSASTPAGGMPDAGVAGLPAEDAQLIAFMNAPDAGPAQLVQERRFRSLLALVPPEERAEALAALLAIDRHWPGLGVGFPSSRLDRR